VARSHGWSGNTPSSDEEAINRILDAADAVIAERGASMRIADVARDLGVTRQTVYRYFPGTDALLVATAMRSADGFLTKLAAHLDGATDPVSALVEGIAYAAEMLGDDSQIRFLLTRRARGDRVASLTSETARTFGRAMLHRLDIDWPAHGFDEDALDELAEFSLRILHSLLLDPGQPARDPASLRRFLARWIAPAIVYPKLAQVMDALMPAAAPDPQQRRRRTAS
jgi:AcrR family transcriptional regulator